MTRRSQAALALVGLGLAGTAAVVPAVTRDKPTVKGRIALAAVESAPTPKCLETPGKQWGGRFHYNAAILRPTVIERACITYPAGRTLVKVSYPAP